METTAPTVIATLEDGSRVLYRSDVDACAGESSPARALAAFLDMVAALPVEQAARWLEGDAAGSGVTVTRGSAGARAIVAGDDRANVTVDVLLAALRALLARRLADEPFWFFRRPPLAPFPSEGDRTFMADLDARAKAFFTSLSELDPDLAAVRRRALLAEIEDAGLLDETHAIDRIYWLRSWGLATAVALAEAARDLWRYLRGDARRAQVNEPPPARLLEGRVSLDWMRVPPPVPPGWDADTWLATCERTLTKHEPPPTTPGGRIFLLQGPVRAELRWRRDDGEHAAIHDAVLA